MSSRNLRYMQKFAAEFENDEFLQHDVAKLPWSSITTIMDQVKDIKQRKWYIIVNKDDFFTNRESAILFGLPSNLIEGILVGRIYENDKTILKKIKELLPNVYICNIDGKVIET